MTHADMGEEEMAQERHGRHHAQVHLTVVGKDGQEEDRVGMEMQRLQPIVVGDFIKEIREGRNQPTATLLEKKGKKVLPSGSGSSEASRSSIFPHSLLSPAVSRHTEARLFSVTVGASRAGSYQAGAEEILTLCGAMGGRCRARLEQIWR